MAIQDPPHQNNSAPLLYTRAGDGCDEAFNSEGELHGHWRYLLDSLSELGSETLRERESTAQRILRDDGATYNLAKGGDGSARIWGLDLVPALVSSEEWGKVEAGLLERSELFDLILKDIYGERSLIRNGVLPPEALFCHGGFLRECQGITVPGDTQLILHATDLMRDARGQFCVLNDRAQSPSGAGYALENRTVMSRVFPSLYRDSHVHRLALFFQRLRHKLNSLSPNQDQPRVAVLTPGSFSETYFEHAYLANYLGLHLVQSGDLLVRNGYCWMKSLDGINRVDVILRRVDDSFCDPVELRSDSLLGVPGLLEIVRAGRVVVANPIGSGVLENPVLLRYLPAIAKALLGRELRLPSVKTYWCGDTEDLTFVRENFDALVIKPIARSQGLVSQLGRQMNPKQREKILGDIAKRPHLYAAQEELAGSHLPTFVEGQLRPRPAILRTFALATDSSYTLMPGGLTRVGLEESGFIISNQAGSQSKDTWVLASEPERVSYHAQEDAAPPPPKIERVGLPSRVVENLFWMGRYAERAEASLRILRTAFIMLNGEETLSEACRRALLGTVTEITGTRPGFLSADPDMLARPEKELRDVLTSRLRAGSVHANLNAILFCADQSRELLSTDTLRVINDIRDALNGMDNALDQRLSSAPEEALDPLVTALMALTGLSQESMIRGVGWRFMEIGRRLERGVQTTTAIKNLLVPALPNPDQSLLTQALLLTLEGLISYRRRYSARIDVGAAIDLVMLDTENPRALLFQLSRLGEHLDVLARTASNTRELSAEQRAVLEAETAIKLLRVSDLTLIEKQQRVNLNTTMTKIAGFLGQTSNAISLKYFELREASQQLGRNQWGSEE